MKKVISVLLAIIMMFSAVSVVFAVCAEDEAPAETTAVVEEEFDFTSLPAWIIPVALKLAKVVLKIVTVFAKLGLIDTSGIVDQITAFIANAANGTVDTTAAAIA